MRLKGRQLRFLLLTLGAWVGVRAWVLWPEPDNVLVSYPTPIQQYPRLFAQKPTPARPEPVEGPSFSFPAPKKKTAGLRQAQPERGEREIRIADNETRVETPAPPLVLAERSSPPTRSNEAPRANPIAASAPSPRRDWEGEAYLFYRPDSHQTALAAGGQLGGSQLAARIAWHPGGGAIGLAVRAYGPIGSRGAEAAAGIDWHPIARVPLRLSVERRQRIDAQGRSAWSAYAAGGFYRARGRLELDGYGQAGVVGTHARDGFVDGALRIGYRLPARAIVPILGAGVWGAAQPGVDRLDIGPRAALRIPAGSHILTAALDGRFRLAGDARPGSGVALTFAADW